MESDEQTRLVERLRPKLIGIAYRMLGVVAEAEDAVQNAFVRYHQAGPDTIRSPEGFLVQATVHASIDLLRRIKRRREHYVGPWLPEPVMTGETAGEDLAESLSLGFLMLLEQLSPVERATFLLREVFGYAYSDIAAFIGKGEQNARQIASRAKRKVRSPDPSAHRASPEVADRMADQFVAACRSGDIDQIKSFLTDDAIACSDGGGKAQAARAVISGRERVARFLAGISRKAFDTVQTRKTAVNGDPGLTLTMAGQVVGVMSFTVTVSGVAAVHTMLNPDKLRTWNPRSDPGE